MSTEETAESRLIGTVTAGYRVLQRIGSGTMGHVYEAEDVSNGKHVALKVLHRSHQKELAARFLREGKTLALLTHPHIVQLVDMGQLDDGSLFLATELIPGGSLRVVMDRGPVEPRRALGMIRQLLDALDAAHALGVVHRDIKPENVMVGEGDAIKVLDFGVAKLLADTAAGLGAANLTSAGFSIFGSALYIAPESVTGQPIDARIDVYSTGAMLFEMLTGRPVFDDQDPSVLLRNHAFDPPPTLHEVAPMQSFSPAIEQLVAKALAKKPEDRYASAADMITAVDAALHVPKPVEPPPRAATELVPRRRRGLLIGGLGLAAVAAVAAVLVLRHSSPPSTTPSADLARGNEELAAGHVLPALTAYERALRADPSLGADKDLRDKLANILKGKDSLASVVALDLLASLTPPAHEVVVAYASNGPLDDARHRAIMLADRDGVGAQVDHVAGWILDLQQASTCDERKETIDLLTRSGDRRAAAAIKRARAVKCEVSAK